MDETWEAPEEGTQPGDGPVPEGSQPDVPEGEVQKPQQSGSTEGPGGKPRRDTGASRDLYLNVRVLVGMMAAFVLLFTFVARVIVVSGPSMESTLWGGDLILVWSLGYEPKQGDVVVLTQEHYQEDSIVKRVIATGGQRVDIDYGTGEVYVDGEAILEDYINEPMNLPAWGEGINHVEIPDGCIFVMGDNRNYSADSRHPDIGIVDTRCVIGRGLAVIFPFHHWQGL